MKQKPQAYLIKAILVLFTLNIGVCESKSQRDAKKSLRNVNALIVIDVQHCFIDGSLALSNAPARENGAEVVPVINKLITTVPFDLIVYSHDWHPINHISFYESLPYRRMYLEGNQHKPYKLFDKVKYNGPKYYVEQILWPAHCIQNTSEAKLHKDLIVDEKKYNVAHVRKGTDPDIDSYSAFADNKRITKTELDDILKRQNVTHVFVVGLAIDYCVSSTAIDAVDLNYKAYVIRDAVRGIDHEVMQVKLQEMQNRGIGIIQSSQVNALISNANYIYASFMCILVIQLVMVAMRSS